MSTNATRVVLAGEDGQRRVLAVVTYLNVR
jgi:hypothetical protein